MLQKSVQVNRKILATPTVQCTVYIVQCTLLKTAVEVLYFNYRKAIYIVYDWLIIATDTMFIFLAALFIDIYRIVGTGKHAYYYMPYVMLQIT